MNFVDHNIIFRGQEGKKEDHKIKTKQKNHQSTHIQQNQKKRNMYNNKIREEENGRKLQHRAASALLLHSSHV